MSSRSSWVVSMVLVIAACNASDTRQRPSVDAATGVPDAGGAIDAGDGSPDASIDAGIDAPATDALTVSLDAAIDAALDGGPDAALDAAIDAATDASVAGHFRTVGALAQPRAHGHAVALLHDGRVLVVGGDTPDDGATWTASAEVFNPATETFSPVGSTVFIHRGPVAVTLADGRVLVIGLVIGPGGLEGKTDLFDPTTNTFSAGPDMAVARTGRATLLPDGRVLISNEDNNQFFDPVSNSFQLAPPLNLLGVGHEALRLAGGRVLLTGGPHQGSSGGGTRNDAEEFDHVTTTFTVTGPMTASRSGHRMAELPGGRALVTGGYIGLGGAVEVHPSADIYDPATRTFTSTGRMTTSRNGHTATALLDGRVLVTGGSSDGEGTAPDNTFEVVATAELFDPTSGTFAATPSMAHPRRGHTATRLLDGRVLVIGGGPPAAVELFTP